jgi:hypothetical protein
MATINTTDPKPGYVYDTDTDTWFPLLGLATQALDELTDVIITTPATNQVLAYDGTNWVNSSEAGDISAVTAGTGITVTDSTGPIPSVAVDTAVVATTNNTLTLSNKTIALGSNTVSGTIAEFNTALTDADFATIGGTETLTNKTLSSPVLVSGEERMVFTGTAATGTIDIDLLTANTHFYNVDATGNQTINLRGSASTSVNTILATNDTITAVVMIQNGGTAYYPTVYQVDGNAVTPKWQGGTAPSSGNTNSIDAYVFTVMKSGSATYTVLASQTKFA